jgi:hypothetical protein
MWAGSAPHLRRSPGRRRARPDPRETLIRVHGPRILHRRFPFLSRSSAWRPRAQPPWFHQYRIFVARRMSGACREPSSCQGLHASSVSDIRRTQTGTVYARDHGIDAPLFAVCSSVRVARRNLNRSPTPVTRTPPSADFARPHWWGWHRPVLFRGLDRRSSRVPPVQPNRSPTTATPHADDDSSRRNGLCSGGRFCGKRYIFAACEYQLLAGKNRQFDLAK